LRANEVQECDAEHHRQRYSDIFALRVVGAQLGCKHHDVEAVAGHSAPQSGLFVDGQREDARTDLA
jgi:hypothetical protein